MPWLVPPLLLAPNLFFLLLCLLLLCLLLYLLFLLLLLRLLLLLLLMLPQLLSLSLLVILLGLLLRFFLFLSFFYRNVGEKSLETCEKGMVSTQRKKQRTAVACEQAASHTKTFCCDDHARTTCICCGGFFCASKCRAFYPWRVLVSSCRGMRRYSPRRCTQSSYAVRTVGNHARLVTPCTEQLIRVT